MLSAYGSHHAAVAGVHQLLQSRAGFQPLSISHTPQTFPVGVRLQKISSPYPSVVKAKLISFVEHASIERVSAVAITGSFQPSAAAEASALFVIVAHHVAPESTCKS